MSHEHRLSKPVRELYRSQVGGIHPHSGHVYIYETADEKRYVVHVPLDNFSDKYRVDGYFDLADALAYATSESVSRERDFFYVKHLEAQMITYRYVPERQCYEQVGSSFMRELAVICEGADRCPKEE